MSATRKWAEMTVRDSSGMGTQPGCPSPHAHYPQVNEALKPFCWFEQRGGSTPRKFETCPVWGASLSFVDNTERSRGPAVKCFVFGFESSLGLGRTFARPQATNGLTRRTPAFTKSARFRVATARPWTAAVAAMRLSLIGMALPVVRRRASSSAHFSPVSASQGRQWRRRAPASNQRSRAARFLPLGRRRIPNRSSPRITGSTAISGSCARSHATTPGSGVGFVGSLRTLASTRYFIAHPSTQSRSGRRSPFADSPVASQRHPRSAEPYAGRGDSPHDRHARRRTPALVRRGPVAGALPAERSGPWRRRSSSYR